MYGVLAAVRLVAVGSGSPEKPSISFDIARGRGTVLRGEKKKKNHPFLKWKKVAET